MARERDDMNAWTVTEIPSTQQQRFSYNADLTVQYAGYAARGKASSDQSAWTIHKFTYDGNKQVTLRQTAFSSWDDRDIASTTYS